MKQEEFNKVYGNLPSDIAAISSLLMNNAELHRYTSLAIKFYLIQVKHNNGFLEMNFNHAGKRKRQTPLRIIDGIEFIAGDFFCLWNFNVD